MRNIPAIQPTTSIASSAQNPSFFRSFQAWYHSSLTWNSSPFLESLRNRSMSIKHNLLSRPSSAMTLATDDNTGPLLQLVLERRIQAVWTTCSRCAADNGLNASDIQALLSGYGSKVIIFVSGYGEHTLTFRQRRPIRALLWELSSGLLLSSLLQSSAIVFIVPIHLWRILFFTHVVTTRP